jgi:hypothetical protein
MAKDKDDSQDVIVPSSGTNHLLDPTQILGKAGELGTSTKADMMRRLAGDKTPDIIAKKNFELKSAFTASGAFDSYGLGTTDGTRAKHRLEMRKYMGEKTPRHNVRGNVSGGGPKSTLRTPKKTFSSYGRDVPYSGNVANFFKSPMVGPAIGQSKHFIPNQGMFDMGISTGPSMLQGVTFHGAWPIFQFKQFTSATAATPKNAEEEDED